jgi:hypothetical protein
MNDLGKLEPIFELNPRFSNLFWEFQMADGMMSERTMSFLSSDQKQKMIDLHHVKYPKQNSQIF